MSWMALHTSPNVNPHATVAWWEDDDLLRNKDADYRLQRIVSRFYEPIDAWVRGYDSFGVNKDIEVALLEPSQGMMQVIREAAPLHDAKAWPIDPHVTDHGGRGFFRFHFVGIHLPKVHRYLMLGEPTR